jgi:hypothetical protein
VAARAKVELQGLEELRAALRSLPEDLAREAGDIVVAHADEVARQAQAAYPESRGVLRSRVSVERNISKHTTAAIVRSRAPHAWLYEFGSRERATRTGASRGQMPQAPEGSRFIPLAIRARARMMDALKAIVRRAGFVVVEP